MRSARKGTGTCTWIWGVLGIPYNTSDEEKQIEAQIQKSQIYPVSASNFTEEKRAIKLDPQRDRHQYQSIDDDTPKHTMSFTNFFKLIFPEWYDSTSLAQANNNRNYNTFEHNKSVRL